MDDGIIGALMAFDWVTLFNGLIQLVGAFALLATMTPNKTDDRIMQVVLDAVNFLGANLGKAKNGEE